MSSTFANTESKRQDLARANLYHVLVRALGPPAEMEAALPAALREVGTGFDGNLHARCRSAADAWEAALTDRESLAVAYARLFLGPFEILAPPYASMYLDEAGQLMGPVSEEAAAAYAEAGLDAGPGPREAPDHVAVEFEYMYFLGHHLVAEGDTACRERQLRFWQGHLGRWLPAFAEAIARADGHPFYTGLSGLLLEWTVHEDRACRVPRL